jgi:hypothetical protein
MVAIVLTDSRGVVHRVYTVSKCSEVERTALDMCAFAHEFVVSVVPIDPVWTVAEACEEIAMLHEATTGKCEVVPAEETPEAPLTPPSLRSTTVVELDWDEDK